MPKTPYVPKVYADRCCIVCGSPFTPKRIDQVYCERGKESKDSCYWKLRLITDPLNTSPVFLRALEQLSFHCWKCDTDSVRAMLRTPRYAVETGDTSSVTASCTVHRMEYYRKLAEGATL